MSDLEDSQSGTWFVSYADHSGNSYRFSSRGSSESARFAYDPVTPEQSSSGTYSGGDPQQGTLTADQIDALWHWIRELEADVRQHAESRMMGTGSFVIREAGRADRRFIIRRGSKLSAFDAFVRPYRRP